MLYILSGPSGAGKSHYRRTNAKLKNLIHIDPQRVIKSPVDWALTPLHILARMKQIGDKDAIAEGIFAPNSPSKTLLERLLKENNINYKFIIVMRPFYDCLQAIKREGGKREEDRERILRATWWKFFYAGYRNGIA